MGWGVCCRQVSFRKEPEEIEFLPTQEFFAGLDCSVALGLSTSLPWAPLLWGTAAPLARLAEAPQRTGPGTHWCPALVWCPMLRAPSLPATAQAPC